MEEENRESCAFGAMFLKNYKCKSKVNTDKWEINFISNIEIHTDKMSYEGRGIFSQ